jgi:hypothetical protein
MQANTRRTIYDIDPENVRTAMQMIPPVVFDMNINGIGYSVIGLQGFRQSQYLKELVEYIEQTQGPDWVRTPIDLSLTCGAVEAVSPELADSVFMAMVYSLSYFDRLSFQDTLCMMELASEYSLPISYIQLIDAAGKQIVDAEDLFVLSNAVSTYLPTLKEQGLSEDQIAQRLADGSTAVFTNSGDNYVTFQNVVEALLFSWPVPNYNSQENAQWKEKLIANLGNYVAKQRSISSGVVDSYVINIASDLSTLVENMYSSEYFPTSLEEVNSQIRGTDEFAKFDQNSQQLYLGLAKSVEQTLRQRLATCFVGWLIRQDYLIDIDITTEGGVLHKFVEVEYDPCTDRFYQTMLTKECIPPTMEQQLVKVAIDDFYGTLLGAQHIVVAFDEQSFGECARRAGVPDPCNNLDVLRMIQFPYYLIECQLQASDLDFVQYGYYIAAVDISKVVDRAVRDNDVAKQINRAVC